MENFISMCHKPFAFAGKTLGAIECQGFSKGETSDDKADAGRHAPVFLIARASACA